MFQLIVIGIAQLIGTKEIQRNTTITFWSMLFLPFNFETRHDGVVTCNALYDGKALEKKCSNEKAKRIRLEKRVFLEGEGRYPFSPPLRLLAIE
jgi:hypothetical protein